MSRKYFRGKHLFPTIFAHGHLVETLQCNDSTKQDAPSIPFGYHSFLYICFCLILLLPSCVSEPDFPANDDCLRNEYKGVFVLNEGVWTQNNSTLDFFGGEESLERCPSVFSLVNGIDLGDTGNAVFLDEDTLYIIVNQSRILYKIQMPALSLLGELQLPEGASPREMAIVSPGKAYLTSLTDSSLYRFDPRSVRLTGAPIRVQNHMEGIALSLQKAFIACGNYPGTSNNKLAVIDTRTDSVRTYIDLPVENPGGVRLHEGILYVNCRGNYDVNGPGSAIVAVDPASETVLQTWTIPGNSYGLEPVFDALMIPGDSAIMRLDLLSGNLDTDWLRKTELTSDKFDQIYELSFDPVREELYVINGRYRGVNGELLVVDPFGNILRRSEAGIFPGEVFFYR